MPVKRFPDTTGNRGGSQHACLDGQNPEIPEHGIDLGASSFYTDSISDLPVLEAVKEPRVVNPDPRLGRLAKKRGWRIDLWR